MSCPKFDFHIHTKYLGCANETMEVSAIVRECKRLAAIEASWNMAERLGLSEDRIWRPQCEPMIGGGE